MNRAAVTGLGRITSSSKYHHLELVGIEWLSESARFTYDSARRASSNPPLPNRATGTR